MSYGDVWFKIISSGSTATSAATAHILFGSYQGLSTLGNNEVVNVQLVPTAADARVWDSTVTNNTGLRLSVAASVFDLPPMRVGNASLLHFTRDGGTNSTMLWTIWSRQAGAYQ